MLRRTLLRKRMNLLRSNHRLAAVAALIVAGVALPLAVAGANDCTVGVIATAAGNGQYEYSGDGGPAVHAGLHVPRAVAVAPDGSLYIADTRNDRVRRVDPAGVITTIAGSDEEVPDGGDGGPATSANLNLPDSVAVGPDGSIYIADLLNHRIRKVDPAGIITTVAGNAEWGSDTRDYSGDGGPAIDAGLNGPRGVAVGPDGSIYIADTGNHRVRKVDPAGVITTIAGNGRHEFSGDGGPATEAGLHTPWSVAVAANGTVYIADWRNYRVREVDSAGTITTVAGNGHQGYSGDGGPAIKAALCRPEGLAIGPDGSIYIADGCKVVRKVDAAGTITTVAGIAGVYGDWGDGGPAAESALRSPCDVAVDAEGTVYVVDAWGSRIRKIQQWPCDPADAKSLIDDLRARAGESPDAWREVAELYLFVKAWDDALAAAERSLAVTPEAEEVAPARAEVLAARAYAGKGEHDEAKPRLIRVLGRTTDPTTLREAAGALVDLHLAQHERGQAISILDDLRVRSEDRNLRAWVNYRLGELTPDR